MTSFYLPHNLKDYNDGDIEELLKGVEAHVRKLRRELMGDVERETMRQLRACLIAEKKNLLEFYFLAEEVEGEVNWVNLEAHHLIKRLPRPLIGIGTGLAVMEHTMLQWVFNDGSALGKPFLPDRDGMNEMQMLRSRWRRGTPYIITERGQRSLAQGYMDFGQSIGETINGFDGQWVNTQKKEV